ncbi:GspE/PulE family protein [Pseudohongiella spirulinae]|uniref:Type II secretory pathway, ATPase PulE/Tfp pilus assembly pathway, ATPase PilB n=1 Tax=Pseudohongiella spirulinae TaxID=1249552 RepID=A0A0S2KFM0_9GAMM|nr:ATPase, T2SS/T4P/T4SS family [Pseudohongiella spirulinae]ALO46915.1 Type II secretory pathway, ATPase PulE/Tfp pilus assembly pathway, ATPase PilB [Pseudohongiella spirulinae]
MFDLELKNSLVQAGLLNADLANQYLRDAQQQDISFTGLLANKKVICEKQLAQTIASLFALPWIDAFCFDFDLPGTLDLDLEHLNRRQILPAFKWQGKLLVLFADPARLAEIDALQSRLKQPVTAVVTGHQCLKKAFRDLLTSKHQTIVDATAQEVPVETNEHQEPAVHFVERALNNAIKCGASDIHFEPGDRSFRVRIRRDGILYESATAPSSLHRKIISRLKIMAELDITERRRPQDGRLSFSSTAGNSTDMRISTLPTLWGEKIVLRIVGNGPQRIHPDALGFDTQQHKLFMQALGRSQGMILVTGPTGSGKSITLFSALAYLNDVGKNIFTVEDPVESIVPGLNQVSVIRKSGLDFSCALRAFLRQDPDIIMVGEVRDSETAEIAVKAAQTGHLLLTTLHTNSAAEAITRLQNMGIATYNTAGAVILIIAQRLCRRLCAHCKSSTQLPDQALRQAGMSDSMIKKAVLFDPVGCAHCHQGYQGRLALFEMIPVDQTISHLITSQADAARIRAAADQAGHQRLRQNGLAQVAAGQTTLAEIDRVC